MQPNNSTPPPLPTRLVCPQYKSNLPSVFSKDTHFLVLAFLTGPFYPQILHFCWKDRADIAGHFMKFLTLLSGKEHEAVSAEGIMGYISS